MPVPKTNTIDIQYVDGSLPSGEFANGLPADGSTISVPADIAQAWIQAGVAKPVSKTAAPAVIEKELE
jgi:hypothetical protein